MPSSGFGHHFTNGSIFPIFFSCLFSTSPLDFNTGSTGQRHENSQQIKCHSFFFGFLHSLVLARGVEATPSPSSEGGSDWPGSRPMAGGGLASDVNSTPPLAPVVSLVMKRILLTSGLSSSVSAWSIPWTLMALLDIHGWPYWKMEKKKNDTTPLSFLPSYHPQPSPHPPVQCSCSYFSSNCHKSTHFLFK